MIEGGDGGRRQFHKHSRNTKSMKTDVTAKPRSATGSQLQKDRRSVNNRKPCARERRMLKKDEGGRTSGDVVKTRRRKNKEEEKGEKTHKGEGSQGSERTWSPPAATFLETGMWRHSSDGGSGFN